MPLPQLAILHGDDDFAIAGRVTELKAEMGDPSLASLNIAELDGKTITLAELRGACDTMPFLTEKRLIIVRGLLTRLTGKTTDDAGHSAEEAAGAGASSQNFVDGLIAYFPELMPSTALALVEPKAVNERSRILKAAEKAPGVEIKKFDVPQGPQMMQWIIRRAKAGGGEFSPAGAEALATAVGDEPRMLAHEIEKLLAYVNWARPVEKADVEQLTPAAGEAEIWDLVDALGTRNAQLAINKYHTLLNMPSQDQFAIFGMIVRQFRLLLLVREILDNGGNTTLVMQTLNQKPYPAEKLVKQARNFTLSKLETIYRRLLDLDLTLKSGGAEDTTAIDTFIAGLTA
ncbi:MAG: DNA polymerase III subunit delta [Chloroflexi bacterium]|nr:DNA polymerase III subunit delta [Chloroflexota bacterium]